MTLIGPVECPERKTPTSPFWYQQPSTLAVSCAFMSPFMATAQSKVLLKAAPNFSVKPSFVQSVSFSLPAFADHTPVPTMTLLGSWDTESRYEILTQLSLSTPLVT